VSTQPLHIQKAVNAWRKTMKEAGEHARTSGVRGFQDFKIHDGYVPLLWMGKKLAAMPDDSLKAYRSLLAKGYEKAGIDPKSAKTISRAVMNRKLSQARGLDTNPGALLSKDSREFLREMLDNDGISLAEQNALFGRIDVTLAERGKSARAKGRVPIDLTVSDTAGRSLLDIVDNDLYSVGSRYFTEIAGRSALARKGIRHDGAWRAVKNAALKEAQVSGHADIAELGEILDSTYSQFLGQPVGTGVHRGARRMMEWTMTSMLGMVGVPQAAEAGNVLASMGIANIFKYSPDLFAYRKAVKAGTVDKSLLSELNAHLGGLWDEHLFMRPEVRLDQALGDSGGVWGTIDNVLAGSKEYLGYVSGLNQVKNIEQQFVAISQANKLVKMVQAGDNNPKILARFKDIGWDEATIKSVDDKIKSGIISFQDNGSVNRLNLEQWDAKTYEDFTVGMHRHSAQIIQFPLIGETATWQHKTFGAIVSQFRSFGMLAVEKQTARQIKMADTETFTAFSYSLGLSALLYTARVHATSLGRPDAKEYKEKRLSPAAMANGALQWSGVFSLASEGVNAAASVGLIPADWGGGGAGRASGSGAFSLDKNIPAVSQGLRGIQLGAGILTSLSPFNDNQLGNKEIDHAFAAVPLGNTYPALLLKNALHNITEED
jgi:hypothetical protein